MMRWMVLSLVSLVLAGCTDSPPVEEDVEPVPAMDPVVVGWSYEGATSTRVCETATPVAHCDSLEAGVEHRRRIDVEGQPLRLTGALVMEGPLASAQEVLIFMQVLVDGVWYVAAEATTDAGVGQIAVDWDVSSMEGPFRVAVSNREYAPAPLYASASVAQPFSFTGELTYQP